MTARLRIGSYVVAAGLAATLAAPAGAWGRTGHQIVARIAWQVMTPDARRLAQLLLGDESFVAESTWADRVRGDRPETYNWHFVSIPVGAARYDARRDCLPTDRGDCVIAAIARARSEIVDPARPLPLRAESLKFLVHFVGDLHQPLHATGNGDRGGNDVQTRLDGVTPPDGRGHPNLHGVWDSVLVDRRGLDESSYVELLLARLPHELTPEDAALDVVAWAEEAHALGVRYVHAYDGFAPGAPGPAPVRLDATYQRIGQAVIDRQLMRGGLRLARLLDDAARTVNGPGGR